MPPAHHCYTSQTRPEEGNFATISLSRKRFNSSSSCFYEFVKWLCMRNHTSWAVLSATWPTDALRCSQIFYTLHYVLLVVFCSKARHIDHTFSISAVAWVPVGWVNFFSSSASLLISRSTGSSCQGFHTSSFFSSSASLLILKSTGSSCRDFHTSLLFFLRVHGLR